MNLLRRCLFLAALTAPALQAQSTGGATTEGPSPTPSAVSANPESPTQTAGSTAVAAPAAPGPTPVVKNKEKTAEQIRLEQEAIHKLAVMKVKFAAKEYDIVIELYPDQAPKTVENFVSNVEKGVYKGLAFHRAIEDYLVQTGDPASKSDDNRDQWGLTQEYTIPGEFTLKHKPGAVAMARRGDNVNPNRESDGTQFYFTVGNLSALNGQYSVFGQVVYGQEVIKKMSRSVHDSNDTPLARIEIKEIKIVDQKGPIVAPTTSKSKRSTKPEALKGPLEKLLERVW